MIENNEQFIPTRIAEYLKAALIASDAASEVLMGKFRSVNPAVDAMGLSSWEKAPGELVTEADIESDQSIKSALSRTHALGDIYSEEGFLENGGGEYSWLVDPLCGTNCYASGLATFGICISLLGPNGNLVLGVITMPSIKERLATVVTKSVTRNGRPWLPLSPKSKLKNTLVGVSVGGSWGNIGNDLGWAGQTGGIISFGSAPYSLFHLASGHLGAQIFFNAGVEHIAAGAAVCQQLGLKVTDLSGRDIDWKVGETYESVLIAWPDYHDKLTALFAKDTG
ncbi:MAG: inositol monophosphatase family protein [Chloroflexota bacterium]|jgi:fructose-1,6-bisphosphatase/inositol monophosphatase family enzyme|tara:strand:+ start:27122 stop:27964 length:843 start_codon:yes stop_codon:yes gene_type:complete